MQPILAWEAKLCIKLLIFSDNVTTTSVAERDAAGGNGKRRIMPEGSGHDAASHTDARRACTIESKC